MEMRQLFRPLQETLEVDIVSAKDCFEYYGNYSVAINGDFLDMPNGSFAYTRREPIGGKHGRFVVLILWPARAEYVYSLCWNRGMELPYPRDGLEAGSCFDLRKWDRV